MLHALLLLLLCQLAGEVLVRLLALPLPGPLLGMALMFSCLCWRGAVPEDLDSCSQGLIRYLPLMFVPAGTGVLLHLERLGSEWLAILASLVLSTLVSVAVTAWVMLAALRWHEQRLLRQRNLQGVEVEHD